MCFTNLNYDGVSAAGLLLCGRACNELKCCHDRGSRSDRPPYAALTRPVTNDRCAVGVQTTMYTIVILLSLVGNAAVLTAN